MGYFLISSVGSFSLMLKVTVIRVRFKINCHGVLMAMRLLRFKTVMDVKKKQYFNLTGLMVNL